MKISMNIILDSLQEYNLKAYFSLPSDKSFLSVALLPGNQEQLSEEKLYICRLSEAMERNLKLEGDFNFICIRDRIEDSFETDETMRGIVVINENISFEKVFEVVMDCFTSVNNWYSSLQDLVIKNCTIQDIIDASEGILKNYIQITDYSFKLLAYTRNISCDEPITELCRKYGFHPSETIEKFNKFNRIKTWEESSGTILVNDKHEYTNYDMISKIFKYRNSYFAHAVMTCNNTPATKGLIELFSIFMDIVGIFVEKEWKSINTCNHTYDSFLLDLLDGNLSRADVIDERARYVNIPTTGTFTLSITSPDNNTLSVSQLAQRFCEIFPDSKILIYQGQVVMLTIYNNKTYLEELARMQSPLDALLEEYNSRIGFSAFFNNLTGVNTALRQATMALNYSGMTPGADLLPKVEGMPNGLNRRIITFEDSFFYILLGNDPSNKDLWQNSIYYKALKMLHDYDEQHNTNNLQLLYVYITFQNRYTETANATHMSRNNAVYRIDRIQEMLNMDLSIPNVRLKLLISYAMLQLHGFED